MVLAVLSEGAVIDHELSCEVETRREIRKRGEPISSTSSMRIVVRAGSRNDMAVQ